jgi:hypothetical protein
MNVRSSSVGSFELGITRPNSEELAAAAAAAAALRCAALRCVSEAKRMRPVRRVRSANVVKPFACTVTSDIFNVVRTLLLVGRPPVELICRTVMNDARTSVYANRPTVQRR